jgi:hypothetical protein
MKKKARAYLTESVKQVILDESMYLDDPKPRRDMRNFHDLALFELVFDEFVDMFAHAAHASSGPVELDESVVEKVELPLAACDVDRTDRGSLIEQNRRREIVSKIF